MSSLASIPNWLTKNDSDVAMRFPAWLAALRKQHWENFLENGIPTRKDERWKYSDLSFLAEKNFVAAKQMNVDHLRNVINQHRLQRGESVLLVSVNGYFVPTMSDMKKLPEQVIACGFNEAIEKHADLIKDKLARKIDALKYPFASLTAAMCTDGLFLHVPDNCEMPLPVHLLSIVIGEDEFISYPQHTIVLGENSKLTFIDEYFSGSSLAYMTSVVTSIYVGKNAQLELYKLQQEGPQAIHMANTFVYQKKDSVVTAVDISTGSLFARDDFVVHLQEKGADCKTSGFYHLNQDNQYIDHHIDINHAAPRSNSEMLFKGILEKKSRAVFNGRLHVETDAQKIVAYQANHNLLLSSQAEVYSKPELEIYADDVKCKHGATTGQIDQEALFYMRSRGIELMDAMHILLQGFAEEVTQRIIHPGVKMRVHEMVRF